MALLDDELEFFGRVIALGVDLLPAHTNEPQNPVADAVERHDQWQNGRLDGVDGGRDVEDRPVRPLQRERFRDHLPDHDMQIGQQGN